MPPPDVHPLDTDVVGALQRVSRRLRLVHGLQAVSAALAGAALVAVPLILAGVSSLRASVLGLTVGGVACLVSWYRLRIRWTTTAAATAIEKAYPASRNLVFTANELLAHPARGSEWIRARVLADAARIVEGLDVRQTASLQRPTLWLAGVLIVWLLTLAGLPSQARDALQQAVTPRASDTAHAGAVLIRLFAKVEPPAYLNAETRTLENPERIEAVEGSRLTLTVTGSRYLSVRFGDLPLGRANDEGSIETTLRLTESGYFAIEDAGAAGSVARKRLLPVAVTRDRAPVITIENPGKDLLLPDSSAVVAVTGAAGDDFGLRSLELRYTTVSGSGEQFEFDEGALPLDITRDSVTNWQARAAMALSGLGLKPGDSLVYRIVGRDGRPGDAGLASSDSFFVEIAGPGHVALAGFEMPPDRDRFALSQQMIVLKIERLRRREPSMARESLGEEAADIAAEQRAVRANFIFLLGGEVEDEEEEATHSHEIQEGRLENTARREINLAIGHMSRAGEALVAVETAPALTSARAAVEALQRAFGRNRYILRALPVRSRVDPSRRLSAELNQASNWRRDLHEASVDRTTRAARALLQRLLDLAPALRAGQADQAALTRLAEAALAIDPAAFEWQQVSERLTRLRDATAADRASPRIATLLNDAFRPIVAAARAGAMVPARDDTVDPALRGAWAEVQRKP